MNKDIVQEVIVSMEATMSIYNLHELGNGSIQEFNISHLGTINATIIAKTVTTLLKTN